MIGSIDATEILESQNKRKWKRSLALLDVSLSASPDVGEQAHRDVRPNNGSMVE